MTAAVAILAALLVVSLLLNAFLVVSCRELQAHARQITRFAQTFEQPRSPSGKLLPREGAPHIGGGLGGKWKD